MFGNRKRLQGITLVELLVSMVITLIIMSGVISVVMSSRSAFTTEQEASFIQENARYAVEILSRDIRLAGSYGCVDLNNVKLANKVVDVNDDEDSSGDGLFSLDAISGFTTAMAYPQEFGAATGDAVILRYGNPEKVLPVVTPAEGSALDQFSVEEPSPFEKGQHLVIVDSSCRYMGFFVNTSAQDARTISAFATSDAEESAPLNCDIHLFPRENRLECGNDEFYAGSLDKQPTYGEGSFIMEYVSYGYFVGESSTVPGVSALKRVTFTPPSQANPTGIRTDELAQGVESLEISYGIDRDAARGSATGLGDVDAFLKADQIQADDWWRVAAIRFNIVFKSQTQVFETDQEVTLNGQSYSDRYLRQVAASTVQIRNR